MTLAGNYFCQALNSRFVVERADDSNGSASGYFEMQGKDGNVVIPVTIHYHFENNVGPITNLWFAGNDDNPNEYVGGAGRTNTSFEVIQLAGGYPTHESVETFMGDYVRLFN